MTIKAVRHQQWRVRGYMPSADRRGLVFTELILARSREEAIAAAKEQASKTILDPGAISFVALLASDKRLVVAINDDDGDAAQ